MSLTPTQKRSLGIINETLKKEHGFTVSLDESISRSKLKRIQESIKKEQRELSYTKEAQHNPEYSQCSLILSATDILLGESARSTMPKQSIHEVINELETKLRESKSVDSKKSKILESKLNAIKAKIYVESKEKELRSLLSESAGQAEVIMGAKWLCDTITDIQVKIGDVLNKHLDPFIERVRNEYDAETSSKVYDIMNDSLEELIDQVRTTKEKFVNVSNGLAGDGDIDIDSVESSMLGSDDLLSDEDDDQSDPIDLGDDSEDSSELDGEQDNDENTDNDEMDLEIDGDVDKEFVRKPE